MEENKTVAEVAPEVAPAVEETKKSVLNASVAPENFDWDAFENEDVYGGDVAAIAEQYNQTLSKVVEGEVVEGVVTSISKREVIVNIGYKSEGVIMAPEFRYNQDLTVGDKVEVFVESTEDKKGQLILSHKKARQLRSWDMVNDAFNAGEIVKGYVKTRTKGGMIVDVFGIEAFLPGSQIDIKPIRAEGHIFEDKSLGSDFACRVVFEVDEDITVGFGDEVAVVGEVFVLAVAAAGFAAAVEDGGAALVVGDRNDGKVDSANAADPLNELFDALAVLGGVNDRVFGDLALAKLQRGDGVAVVVKKFDTAF